MAATLPRVLGVIADAAPAVVLTTSMIAVLGKALGGEFARLPWICVELLDDGVPPDVPITAIYHCAAEIDWIKPYSSLAPINVGGTRELVRLACLGPRPLHYVSTIGVYPLAEDARLPFSEDAPLASNDQLQLGYTQSKWVAEKLVEHARARGLDVTVYRPGFIAGDSRDGRERDSTHLLLYAFLAGCIQLREAPSLDKVIDAVPVDWLGDAIAAISLVPESRGQRLNLVNPVPLRQRAWYALLRSRGYELAEVAYPRWRQRVLEVGPDPVRGGSTGCSAPSLG